MQVPSLGVVGSLAATPLAQRGPEAEKAHREAAVHRQAEQSLQAAEAASGIGQTQEESEASDRDADGRRLWEESVRPKTNSPDEGSGDRPASAVGPAPDPTGQCGTQLDLLG